MIWSAAFWKGAGERAVQTFAQTFLASVVVITGAEVVTPAEFIAAPWATAATTAGLAAAVSLVVYVGAAASDVRSPPAASAVGSELTGSVPAGAVGLAAGPVMIIAADAGVAVPAKP